jgi:hypothetical protein
MQMTLEVWQNRWRNNTMFAMTGGKDDQRTLLVLADGYTPPRCFWCVSELSLCSSLHGASLCHLHFFLLG